MQLLTLKSNNSIIYMGEIEKILKNEDNSINEDSFKIQAKDKKFFYVNDIDKYNLFSVDKIPEYVERIKWCYTEERNFFEISSYVELEIPKSEISILKEQLEVQEQTIAEQDGLLAMLLLGE